VPPFATKAHAWLYRKTNGRVLGRLGGQPVLLLTTTGRRTHVPRTTPVQFIPSGNRFVVVAANGGAARPPAWHANLLANPEARVQVRDRRVDVRAVLAEGQQRDRLWRELTDANRWLRRAEQRARRRLPVVVLEPR
jgi:deazaflavin-dependent oxidoreductase (nitroreductase family)